MSIKRKYLQWLKSFLPLLLLLPLTVVLVLIRREYFDYENIMADIEALGVFYSVFGMIYAILTGLLLLEELRRLELLTEKLDLELNALQDIRDFLIYLDGDQHETEIKIKTSLMLYVKSVCENDWKAMSGKITKKIKDERTEEKIGHAMYKLKDGETNWDKIKRELKAFKHKVDIDITPQLENLMKSINNIKITNESDHISLESIMSLLADVTTYRTQRITLAQNEIPEVLYQLIFFMSSILAIGIILMGVQSLWIHLFIALSINISLIVIYILFQDLKDPFSGTWQISNDGYKRLQRRLKVNIKEHKARCGL